MPVTAGDPHRVRTRAARDGGAPPREEHPMIPIRDTVPSRHAPVVTWGLIAVNVAVFLYQLTLPEQAQQQLILVYGIVPARFTHPAWASSVGFPPESLWPFITSQFLH